MPFKQDKQIKTKRVAFFYLDFLKIEFKVELDFVQIKLYAIQLYVANVELNLLKLEFHVPLNCIKLDFDENKFHIGARLSENQVPKRDYITK